MKREQDPTTGACYFILSDEVVAGTVHVSDLIAVDVDAQRRPVGVEFAFDPGEATAQEWTALWAAYPALRAEFEPPSAPRRPQDTNQLAASVVADAVGEVLFDFSHLSAAHVVYVLDNSLLIHLEDNRIILESRQEVRPHRRPKGIRVVDEQISA